MATSTTPASGVPTTDARDTDPDAPSPPPPSRPAPPKGGRSPGARWVAEYGWRHLCAVLALLFAFFPVAYVVSASFNPTGSIAAQQLIPDDPTIRNYEVLFTQTPFFRWLGNTILIAGGASVTTVFLCACAAYAFSRMRFRGRRGGLLFILLAQMFPPVLAFVALFLIAVELGGVFPGLGINSRLLLYFIYLGMALSVNTWLMKGFFDTLPVDMDESARIDGASHAQIFFRIVLPLATPILAVIFLLTLIATNTDFIVASIVLRQEDSFTLSVGLTRFISGQYGARWGPFAAGAIVGSLPVIAVFVWLQKYLVSNLTAGAVKG
jgi:arabinogalactan oligomer/maltooligosaccharide transport system permease protein